MTLIHLDNHSGVPIFRQIQDQIRQQILAGQLATGAQLSPVRDLAIQIRVNPMTVSKAYALLEAEGLLERRRGVGLFVAPLAPRQRDLDCRALLTEALRAAAASAIQMGIDEDEAMGIYRDLMREYSKRRDQR